MASIWTQEDIDRLKGFISSGIQSVSYQGPPGRSITYQSLSAARELLAEMIRDVNGAKSHRKIRWSKGF